MTEEKPFPKTPIVIIDKELMNKDRWEYPIYPEDLKKIIIKLKESADRLKNLDKEEAIKTLSERITALEERIKVLEAR